MPSLLAEWAEISRTHIAMEGKHMDSKVLAQLKEEFLATHSELDPNDLAAVEAAVEEQGRHWAHAVLSETLAAGKGGYEGTAVSCVCGGWARFVGYRTRQVHTCVGWIEVRRAYYHCSACKRGIVPLDGAWGLGRGTCSAVLARRCCALAAERSFQQSSRLLEELTGQRVDDRTIGRLTHLVGGRRLAEQDEAFSAFLADRQPPAAEVTPSRLYVAVDGTTVPERDGWHEAKAASIYFRDGGGRCVQRYVGRFDCSSRFGWETYLASCRRGYREAKEVVYLGDGAEWIRTEHAAHFGKARFIVDWYHASEHVWDCGKALYGEGTAETSAWVARHLDWLWEGEVESVVSSLAAERKARRGKKRKALAGLIGYVGKNAEQMRYGVFRALGYDIGSGAVEGACKHVIGSRLKQAGMRWIRSGSSATLALRTCWLNQEWNDFWSGKPMAA